jgi:hypothetical protein
MKHDIIMMEPRLAVKSLFTRVVSVITITFIQWKNAKEDAKSHYYSVIYIAI